MNIFVLLELFLQKNSLYMAANVFSLCELIGENILLVLSGDLLILVFD